MNNYILNENYASKYTERLSNYLMSSNIDGLKVEMSTIHLNSYYFCKN